MVASANVFIYIVNINILAASHRHLISELLQHKQQLTQ